MKYIIFLTTNLKSRVGALNKIYIGIHKTNDPEIFDGYLGDGVYRDQATSFMYPKTPFQYAVKKYGVDAFFRSILYVYNTEQEAHDKLKELVDSKFLEQSFVYNNELQILNKPIYQFDQLGNKLKKWESFEDLINFTGYPKFSFDTAIKDKTALINNYWSTEESINHLEYSPKLNQKVYIYNTEGKCIKMYGSNRECAIALDLPNINKVIQQEILIDNKYYLSNTLTDNFNPKPRRTYLRKEIHVYDSDNKYYGCFVGKEIMKVIDLHSWTKISNAFKFNKGWYKNFYLSEEKVDKVPERVFGHKIDVYTKTGDFIETLNSVKEAKEKYNITTGKFKNVQLGQRYFGDYIFKYHS